MAKKAKATRPRRGRPARGTVLEGGFMVRGSGPWLEWVRRLNAHARDRTFADTIELGLAAYAKNTGFREPIPDRLPKGGATP